MGNFALALELFVLVSFSVLVLVYLSSRTHFPVDATVASRSSIAAALGAWNLCALMAPEGGENRPHHIVARESREIAFLPTSLVLLVVV